MKSINILLSLVLVTTFVFSQTISFKVKGTLLGADGKPMPAAHVHMMSNEPANPRLRLQTTPIGNDGKFSIEYKTAGVYRLQFTGVNHYPLDVALYSEKTDSADLKVTLRSYVYNDAYGEIFVLGNFNNYSRSEGTEPLEQQPDGTYKATVDVGGEEEVIYQMIDLEVSGLLVNGTQNEGYRFDGKGGYYSLLRTQGGETNIYFDPAKLIQSTADASVKFRDEKSLAARFSALDKIISPGRERYALQYQSYIASGKQPSGFTYDWSNDLAAMEKARKSENDATLKNACLLAMIEFGGAKKDTLLAKTALTSIDPASPLWSYFPNVLTTCVAALSERQKYIPYVKQVIEDQPDGTIKPLLLSYLLDLAESVKDSSTVTQYYQKLLTDYPKSPFTEKAKLRFEPAQEKPEKK